jgi:fucose permease
MRSPSEHAVLAKRFDAAGHTLQQSSSLRLMWAGFLGILVWGTIAPLLGSILPTLRERAGLSLTGSGGLFVALSSGMVVASLAAGVLLDRFGKKFVLCAAAGLIAAALMLLEFARSYPALVVLAFTLGAGGSALVTGAHGLLADLHPGHRSAALNLLDVFFGVGAFVTSFVIVPLQRSGGLAAVLFVLAAMTGLVLLYLATVVFPSPRHARDFSMAEARRILVSSAFLVPALIIFLYVGTEQSIFDWQVTFLLGRFSMDRVTAARALSWFPVAIMIGRIVNNRLLMRVSPLPVLLASTLGAAAGLAAIMVIPDSVVASAVLSLVGLFMASIFPTTLGVLSGRFADLSGTALGLAITFGWFGSFIVSPTFGFVAHTTGGTPDYSRGYFVIVGSAAAMALMTTVLTRQRARGEAFNTNSESGPVARSGERE